jgi:predicted nucleotidyltransferase
MELKDRLQQRRDEILRLAAEHGAYNVRIFGSTVRGEAGPESDIDLLVDVGPDASPWFPVGLVINLEALLADMWRS